MNTDKKAVFFDADGTICDIEKGVPDSAVEAIRKLRENGHEAWLCTGRSRAFVPGYLEQIPFTGMISACGATIEKDGQRLYNKEMPVEVAKLSVETLRKYGLIPVMEGADFISAKMTEGCNDEEACRELSQYYDVIRHENNAFVGTTIELVPKGCNKAVGIAAVCRIFDIPWESTVVFGDSNNDLSMFEYAATKVAMGNGSQKIRELADYVTTDMFHYGIRNGLTKLGLI